MRTVVFLDLDDTLFQTRPKCPPGDPVRPAAFARDGSPLSFATDRQHALLDRLSRDATVIPTTARSLEAYRRVDFPFHHAAILDFGAVVLTPDGRLDLEWDAVIRPQMKDLAGELQEALGLAERFARESGANVVPRLIADFDMTLYLVAKHSRGDGSRLIPLGDALRPLTQSGRYFLHLNDNNLSLVPACLGKELAVRHVLQRYFADGPVLTLGVGDSLTDAAFMGICDFSLTPRGSQLARHRLPIPRET